mmetsp:Transcript_29160/g.38829  ORF Transcript_29160/g.38829 Transcript_29160/m.38829 type:complete len:95 (-) Transcript_29160:599-883(-)
MEQVMNKGLTLKYPGAHAVNFYTLGVPHTVVVDDFVPFLNNKPLFARINKDDPATWPLILEKAFAKVRGNYYHLVGGYSEEGVRYMTGGPQVTL